MSADSARSTGSGQTQGVSATEHAEVEAERLFTAARADMLAGQFQSACPKLQRSLKLAPATGTLLNLAVCHENVGRLANAWLEYLEAMNHDPSLVEQYGPHDEALEQRLERSRYARLKVDLSHAGARTEVVVAVNGVFLSGSNLGRALPADPGTYEFVAFDAAGDTWRETVKISGSEAGVRTVRPFEPERPARTSTSTATTDGAVVASGIPATVYLGIGVSAALLGGSVVTGILAHERASTYEHRNSDSTHSVEQRRDARDSAKSMQYVNAGFIVGTALSSAATVLLYIHGSGESSTDLETGARPSRRATFSPWVGAAGAGLSWSGTLD